MIKPFRIEISDAVLEDLKARLARTRWPQGVVKDGGIALSAAQEITSYWLRDYRWRRQESELNAFAHYQQPIDGLQVHFIHERCERADALPLLLLHGWPGSFVEMLDIIPLLKTSFHVVVPSIPGYGFSEAPTTSGWSNSRIAELMDALMASLSYQRYGVHGGDVGAGIATWMARKYESRIVGLHLNYIPGSFRPTVTGDLTASESGFLKEQAAWSEASGAYGHVHRTRPLTLSYGLSDSPVGLATWIIEKFNEWSDPDIALDRDRLLTNIMLYWTTNSMGSAIRLYLESAKTPLHFEANERINVPCGIVRCPRDIPFPPRSWVERVYNVVQWSEFPKGGHFAALEVPHLLAGDISGFFAALHQ